MINKKILNLTTLFAFVVAGGLLLFFSNCSAAKTDTTPEAQAPDFTKLQPSCFQAYASNPVLTGGSLLSGADWNDPSVIKVGSNFVMYASSDQSFDFNIKIYRLISSDGLSWTLSPASPVFQADPSALAWDHRATETPNVVFFNNQYHLFYTGYPVTYTDSSSYKIGHAVSSDGISWTRDASYILAPTNPSGAPNLDFNQFVVGEPGAVVFNNKIYLYFTAVGANAGVGSTLQVIGLTTSSDGMTWSTPLSVLEPDQLLYPRSTWLGLSTPQPIVLNGEIHLFFDVAQATPFKQLRLQHAHSANGISSWTFDTSPIFSQSSFSWSSNEILAPTVLLDGTRLHLWFAGNNSTVLGIGQAQCDL